MLFYVAIYKSTAGVCLAGGTLLPHVLRKSRQAFRRNVQKVG